MGGGRDKLQKCSLVVREGVWRSETVTFYPPNVISDPSSLNISSIPAFTHASWIHHFSLPNGFYSGALVATVLFRPYHPTLLSMAPEQLSLLLPPGP